MSTLHTAYLAAVEAARIAAQAWMDDDSATQEDLTHPARIATDAADAVRDAARDAWLESDEPREWDLYEDCDCYATHWGTLEEAMAAARCNIDAANYEVTQTIWIDYRVVCKESGEEDGGIEQLDPLPPMCEVVFSDPDCASGHDHDWCSPLEVVGGCKSNPGVHGHGGGVVITEVCSHCGCYRVTDTWAQRPDTGQQGLTSVEYRDADDASTAWVGGDECTMAESEAAPPVLATTEVR